MIEPDKIITFISTNGPSLPVHVSKATGLNLIMSGAVLSSLVSEKKLKISNIKIGGSPLYYIPGQESKLVEFSKHLGDKHKIAFENLKSQGILRDSSLEPVIRAALRSLKDFAVPLDVTYQNKTDTFWKWYLLPEDQVEQKIASTLQNNGGVTTELKGVQAVMPKEEPKLEDTPQNVEKIQETKTEVEPQKNELKTEDSKKQKNEQDTNSNNNTRNEQQIKSEIDPKIIEKEIQELKIEDSHFEKKQLHLQAETIVNNISSKDAFSPIKKPKQSKLIPKNVTSDNEFHTTVLEFLKENDIDILEHSTVRKGADYAFILNVPSPVGMIRFYCRSKSKKKFNEADLSNIYLEGQSKKLPILLITNGDLTKKAESLLETRFIGLTVNRLENGS